MSNIEYNFVVKHLNQDRRGYASDAYFEMESITASGQKVIASICVSFGGDDYKPASSWSQSDIDALAESYREDLQQQIDTNIAALESQK